MPKLDICRCQQSPKAQTDITQDASWGIVFGSGIISHWTLGKSKWCICLYFEAVPKEKTLGFNYIFRIKMDKHMKQTRNIWNHLHFAFPASKTNSESKQLSNRQPTNLAFCALQKRYPWRESAPCTSSRRRESVDPTAAQHSGLDLCTCVTFTGDFSLFVASVPRCPKFAAQSHDCLSWLSVSEYHHLRKPKMAISCFKRFQAQLWGLPGDRQNYQKSNHCVAAFFADSEQGIVRPSVRETSQPDWQNVMVTVQSLTISWSWGCHLSAIKSKLLLHCQIPQNWWFWGLQIHTSVFLIAHQATDWLKFGTQGLEQCSYRPQACGWNQPWRHRWIQHPWGSYDPNTVWDAQL